jgi:HEAT repeat protein
VPALVLRVPNVQLGGLAQRLADRGVRSVRFEQALEAEALAALVEILAGDPEDAPEPGVAAALYARAPRGIVVNGAPAGASPEAERGPRPVEAPAPQAGPAPEAEDLFDTQVRDLREDRADAEQSDAADAEGSDAAASVEAERPAPAPGEGDWSLDLEPAPAAAARREVPEPSTASADFGELGFDETPATEIPLASAPRAESETPVETSDATPRTTEEDTDTEAVEAERDARSAGGYEDDEDGRAAELEHLLAELGDCEDDFQYHDMARRAEQLSSALAEEGYGDLAYRALVVFARHSGDDGKRTALQRDAAMDHLQRLATGARLAELIDRACAPETEPSLEATQVLLRLGSSVVPMLFRAAERESEPNRRGQIHGILIAMGEAALPEVLRAFESGELPAVRGAARLSGELQNPRAVAPLAALFEGPEASLRQEAAKALVRIGDPRAIDALVRGLESEVAGVPNLAAFCLGAAASPRAGEALLAALRRAVGRRRYDFAGELVRALGRLGRPEAAADLAALLAHRGLRYRSAWRELKLAAAAALGRIPGDDALTALAEATRARDPQLRRAAQSALDRRASALSR